MSTHTSASAEAHATVDLSQLVTFNIGFGNLELVLKTILSRLDNVETNFDDHARDNVASFAAHSRRADEVDEAIEDLKQVTQEQKDLQTALGLRCEELESGLKQANELLTKSMDRADDAHRRIDALESAIRDLAARQAAALPPVALTTGAPPPATSAVTAESRDFSPEIAALQAAVRDLVEGKADRKIEEAVKATQYDLAVLSKEVGGVKEALGPLNAKIDETQHDCRNVDASSKRRDEELEKKIGAAPTDTAPVRQSTPPPHVQQDLSWQQPLKTLLTDVAKLKADSDSVASKLAALGGLGQSSSDPVEVSAAQFVMLQAAVAALENRPLAKDYDDAINELRQQTARLSDEVKVLGTECSRNADECKRLDDRKANKGDLDALAARVASIPSTPAAVPFTAAPPVSPRSDDDKQLADVKRRVEELQRQAGILDGRVKLLDSDKAPADSVRALADDVAALRKQLQDMSAASRVAAASAGAPAAEQTVVAEMQKQLGSILEDTAKNMDWTKGQVLEIRATIEHIHHTKADTSMVANKAEREFVENSMEKLMREVEQVLNATNAGLIDTLDKSLNILRDMIDGKATKNDVVKLQSMINDEQSGNVPEGLTGFKSYRCLGCNRTLDGMRQRPMGANFATFMNRTPAGARPAVSPGHPSSAQGPRIVGPSPPAGYITNTPQSQ